MYDTINRYLSILCYPFASVDFFLEDYFAEILCEEEQDCKKGRERRKKLERSLKEALIRNIQRNGYLYSYDEVYMYLEKFYLHSIRSKKFECSATLYMECMENIMHSMISQRDGKVIFKYWESHKDKEFLGSFGDANKIFLFHGMNMHMPLDFIVMLYIAQNPDNTIRCLDNYYGQIEVADQQLDVVLKTGVAENHLHKGVSLSFLEIWDVFMMPLSSASIRGMKKLDVRLGNGDVKEEKIFFFLLTSAIFRVWVAISLQGGILEKEGICIGEPELCQILEGFEDGKKLGQFYEEHWGWMPPEDAKDSVVGFCQRMWGTLLQILPEQKEGRSIMQEIFQVPDYIHTSDENIFLFHAMRFFMGQKRGKTMAQEGQKMMRSILQYLRIKNHMFGCVVQKKNVRGLDYFQKKFYRNDSALNHFYGETIRGDSKKNVQVTYWEQAMRKQFQNRDLKKIEFRASLDKKEARFRKSVRAFLEAYCNIIKEDYAIRQKDGSYKVCRPFPRVGLIFHLIKQEDDTAPEKCFLDGLGESERMHFGVLKKLYDEQISCMRRVRDSIPGLDRYIVGIDAASLENATPTWVFAEAYEKARDSSVETVAYDGRGRQSLRFTFHAGEDFRHILSGLRRIDEAATFLKFHAGDRIGHGTALGIPPESWHRSNPFVVLPGIEALENYVWAYYVLSQDMIHFHATLMAYIERRVYELSKIIYGNSQGVPMQVLVEGYQKMFQMQDKSDFGKCKVAEDTGFCEAVRKGQCSEIIWNGEKIVLAHHCIKFLSEMEHPIDYEVTQQDIQITETMQDVLRQKLGRKGIVVEINPSSNTAIGEVDKITDNQIYQLNQPDRKDNVMVCINSDDPTVFHTNVSNEFAYIYYGMLYHGVSRESALAWIDKVRECGMKSSFIQEYGSGQEVYQRLEGIIQQL